MSDWPTWLRRTALLLGVVLAGYILWLLWQHSGAKQGAVLAFAGSLLLAWPAIRQLISNGLYRLLESSRPKMFGTLVAHTRRHRLKAFTRFSWPDAWCFLIGALMLALGSWLQVVS